jgi:hypothetical protein
MHQGRSSLPTLLVRRLPAALALVSLTAAVPALAAERSFPVGNFTGVTLSGSPDVEVRTGVATSVVAQGEAADLDRLDIRVEGDRLVIATKPGSWNWSARRGVRVRVGMQAVSGAAISGAGTMSVDRVAGPFSARISGSGDMRLPSVDSETLTLATSGSGDMTVAGRCGAGTVSVTGSGNIDAGGLTCRTLAATVTGSGDITAAATDTATLRVTGSGDIAVTGGARCTAKSTGSGTTSCR